MRLERFVAAATFITFLQACDAPPQKDISQESGKAPVQRLVRPGEIVLVPTATALTIPTPAPIGELDPPGVGLYENFDYSPEEIMLQRMTKDLGIAESLEEQRLWASGYQRSEKPLSVSGNDNEARRRVEQTMSLMGRSTNPYLKGAFDFHRLLQASSEVSFNLSSTLPWGIYPSIEKGQIHYTIVISLDDLLNNSNALTGAAALAHELEHIKNYKASIDGLQVSVEDKLSLIKKAGIEEEARGYGVEYEALIYAYAQGYKGPMHSSVARNAVAFLTLGQDPSSDAWKNYVATTILKLPSDN